MTNTIDEKISLLTKIILERIESDFQQRQKQLMDNHDNRVNNIIRDYEEKKRMAIEKVLQETQNRKQKTILKVNTENRLTILKKRKELMERVLEELKKRVMSFLLTEEYEYFLTEAIKKVLSRFNGDQFIELKFSNNDITNRPEIILNTINSIRNKATYQISVQDGLLGGVFARSKDGRLEADFTINTVLEESHKKIGEILTDWLNKES